MVESCYQNKISNDNRSKRIATNTLVLFARMLIITCVNLFTVRWVLNGLGATDYGIFNAVAGVVTASTCISSVLALSTQRFYSYAMGQGKHEQLKEIFTVSLQIVVILSAIVIVIFELLGPWFVSTQLTIPAARLDAASWVLQFSLFSFIFTLLQIPFIGAIFSNEDMGIYAFASTLDCIVKLFIAYMIGKTNADNLIYYGAAMMAEAFLLMAFYVLVAYRKYPECRYQKVNDKKLYKQLFAFSGWTFYGALSGVGMTQGSVIILNIFFGPIINAAFSIANQIYNAINTLSNSIVIAFRPAMIKAYSAKETEYLKNLFYTGNKAIFYLLSMVVIPFFFEGSTILTFWLGHCTAEMVLFSKLYLIYAICLSLHNPITTIIQGTGHIKNYSLYVESLTILCLPISWLLFHQGCDSYYIFIVMITLCIGAQIIRLKMLKDEIPSFTFRAYLFRFVCPASLVVGTSSTIVYLAHSATTEYAIMRFMLTTTTSVIAMTISIYIIGLSKQEKSMLKKLAKRIIKK